MRTFSLHQNKHISRKFSFGKPVYRVWWKGRVTRYPTLSLHLFKNKMSSIFGHFFIETSSERFVVCFRLSTSCHQLPLQLDKKKLSMTLLFQAQMIYLKKQLFSFKKAYGKRIYFKSLCLKASFVDLILPANENWW